MLLAQFRLGHTGASASTAPSRTTSHPASSRSIPLPAAGQGRSTPKPASAAHAAAPSPARALAGKLGRAFGGGQAAQAAPVQQDWTEF
jgi:methyl-accepting chemotaxis protein